MITRFVVFFILCLFAAAYATAQSSNAPNQAQPSKPAPKTPGSTGPKRGSVQLYGLGDQMFVMNVGLLAPLFVQDASSGLIQSPKLSAGAAGSLGVDVFLNNSLAVGAHFAGAFSFGVNSQALFLIPITARIEWIFHVYPFDFPVFFEAGVNFMRLNNQLYVGPIVKPGVGGYWNITSKWALGLSAEYWWVPEIYFGSNPPSSRSMFGNFLLLSLSAIYHF